MQRLLFVFALSLLCAVPALAARQIDLAPGQEPCSVELVSSDLQSTVLRVQINHFLQDQIDIKGRQYATIALAWRALRQEKGSPALPTIRESILIPDDAEMSVRVLAAEYRDFSGVDVAPSKGSLSRDVDPATIPFTFGACYRQGAWYPEALADRGLPYILRDTRGLVVEINPFQYNPATHTLRVYTTVTVAVEVVGPGKTNVLTRHPVLRSQEFERIYARHYLNYGAGAQKYTSVPEVGPMLVVTHDAFHGYVQPLVDWKNQLGVPTTLVDMSAIGATANDLMNYIQNLYDTTGLAFVLLVGDGAQIPYLTNAGAAADPMYALTAGSDSYPDLFVGRMSAENPVDVSTQVTRSIEYERDPQLGADWYHKATGIGSDDDGGTGTPDWQRIDQIRDLLLGFTFTEVDQIYDPGATANQVSSAVNAGRSLINYMGHGGPTGWSTTGFSNAEVNALVNDNLLPWIISVACNTGQYHNTTCFAEAWMRATNGAEPTGASGMYASTVSMQWMPPVAAQFEIANLLVTEAKRTLGGLCYNGSCEMIDQYGANGETEFKNWILFGDPSLRVRTDTPAALAVSHAGVVVPALPTFTVNTEPGALACLSDGGVFHGSAFADAGGVAEITIVGTLPFDEVTLTVTGFNKIPHVETVPVGDLLVPTCDVLPEAFIRTMDQDQVQTDWLHLSNNGEEGSTLYYSISLVDSDYPTKVVAGGKNLSGSYVEADLAEYYPGTTVDVVFDFHNESPDQEWLKRAELDFPGGVVVNSATDISVGGSSRIPYEGATGDGVVASWEGDYNAVVYDNETGAATVNISFSGVSGDVVIPYVLIGDQWGGTPHQVSGSITITMAGPDVSVVSPNGGEVWAIDTEQAILFTAGGGPENVRIELDRGLRGWELIAKDVPAVGGSFAWTVTGPVSAHCRIKVTDMLDPAVADSSDAEFTIFRALNWIAVDRYSGDVPQGSTDDIQVTFDTSGLPYDEYHAEIVIASNAGDPVVVPVTLIVDPGLSAVGDAPAIVTLGDNSPNPFNPRTTISFVLPAAGRVDLGIYDVSGQRVRTMLQRDLPAGTHHVVWDGKNSAGRSLASGVYFYRLETGKLSLSKKMLLLK